jgi:chlorobactene glucosyltransferase
MLIWTLTLLSVAANLVFAVLTTLFLRRRQVLQPAAAPAAHAPLISIIVPARNEAANIERCVRSILAQDYPYIEVIAVDDDSTDATPIILADIQDEDRRLRVVTGTPMRMGWTGKNNALDAGVKRARGDWLLFVDADMTLHSGALSAAFAAAQRSGATMVTLWARQQLESFWERVVQPVIIGFNVVADPFQHVNDPSHRSSTANGQFILVERETYERIGGHSAVRDEVLEDQMLAQHFKRAGERILMMDGTHLLSTRMYTSLQGIWEGWSKNNFLSFNRNMLIMLASAVGVYLIAVNPFMMVWATLIALKFNHHLTDPLIINLCSIALLLWTRWRVRSFCGTPLRDYLLHGVGAAIFIGIFFNSAYCHITGHGVTWKGRSYSDVDSVA